jgi:2-polyprenyl-3-methyl-5-hydroxy-6-metoxy-1,4-benzoquinol methylase
VLENRYNVDRTSKEYLRMSTPAEQSLRERFAKYHTPNNAGFFEALVAHMAAEADNPCIEMYFNYAISTNDRGRRVADLLARHVDLKGATFLDIGCAYAGFLVAFAERGAKVHGLEISTHNARLAAANLNDAGLDVEILYRDATRLGDIIEFSNRIDAITCNDVIEHVEDPLALARHISLMLRPGGVAYLEFPNRYFPRFVLADGHYGLFGITLLDYSEAKEYFSHQKPGTPYDTKYYLDLDQCEALFQRAGLRLELLPQTFDGVTVDAIRADVAQLEKEADHRLSSVPAAVAAKVSARLPEYLRTFHAAPTRSEAERQTFLLRYGPSFWRVLARKDVECVTGVDSNAPAAKLLPRLAGFLRVRRS